MQEGQLGLLFAFKWETPNQFVVVYVLLPVGRESPCSNTQPFVR